jgi:VWFA-related protein
VSRRVAAFALALLGASRASGQVAPPVFTARVESVYVDVVVTRSGRPVPGLAASDFELRDEGVVQQLELVSAETRPLTALLVFDTSSSMEGKRMEALRAAGAAFLDGLRPGDSAGLVTFSEEIAYRARPATDRAPVREALARIQAGGATAVLDALFVAISLADTGTRPLVVLFSDGEDNVSWLDSAQLRAAAERSNAVVHVVSWPEPPALTFGLPTAPVVETEQDRLLREIAEATGGRAWRADSPGRLREAFAGIADAMGHRYVLRYEPSGAAGSGFHRLEIRLRDAKGEVQARRGYFVP